MNFLFNIKYNLHYDLRSVSLYAALITLIQCFASTSIEAVREQVAFSSKTDSKVKCAKAKP